MSAKAVEYEPEGANSNTENPGQTVRITLIKTLEDT